MNEGIFLLVAVSWFFFITLFVGGRVKRGFEKRVQGRKFTEKYWAVETDDPVVQKEGERYMNRNLAVVFLALGPPVIWGIVAVEFGFLPW